MSDQKAGKYACLEIERKYLLRRLPSELADSDDYWCITDRYVVNTRLRARQMVSPSGQTMFKFGQKFRAVAQPATQTTITNLYLNETEYQYLARLGAHELIKRRYRYVYEGRSYSIDVFEEKLTGLILAEIECDTDEACEALPLPAFALKEVTADPFFSGGNLAKLSEGEFRRELERRLV